MCRLYIQSADRHVANGIFGVLKTAPQYCSKYLLFHDLVFRDVNKARGVKAKAKAENAKANFSSKCQS